MILKSEALLSSASVKLSRFFKYFVEPNIMQQSQESVIFGVENSNLV